MKFKIRTGIGYDVHPLKTGIELWLGGIQIDHDKGAVGHSDADVLIHSICDALLGAACLGDIGQHFPDNDPKYKAIDSKILLSEVGKLIKSHGYSIGNIDSTIVLQNPKIGGYIPKMRRALSSVLLMDEDDVSIKATTTEKLGFIGKEEGIAAYASVLIYRK